MRKGESYKMLVPDDIETLQSPKIGICKAHLSDNRRSCSTYPQMNY